MTTKTPDFLHTNDFLLTVGDFPDATFYSQRLTVPTVVMGTRDIAVPNTTIHQPSGQVTFEPLSFTFKVDEEVKNYAAMLNWFLITGNLREGTGHSSTSDIFVTLPTNKGNPSMRLHFRNAYPESLSSFDLSTMETATIYADVTATFRYSYFTLEKA